MPIYEYVCKKCRHRFETIVRGSSKTVCPSCGASRLEKQLSVFAVGSGGGGSVESDLAEPCRSCGDPRGPGACSLN